MRITTEYLGSEFKIIIFWSCMPHFKAPVQHHYTWSVWFPALTHMNFVHGKIWITRLSTLSLRICIWHLEKGSTWKLGQLQVWSRVINDRSVVPIELQPHCQTQQLLKHAHYVESIHNYTTNPVRGWKHRIQVQRWSVREQKEGRTGDRSGERNSRVI